MLKRSLACAVVAATFAAGSASAADDFEVGVSGFINAGFMALDVDNNHVEYDATSIRTDNLIDISGETVLDNGLKVSAVAGFSLAYNSDGDGTTHNDTDIQKENLYVQVGSAFGDVRLGRSRNAGALLHTYIPSAGVGTFAVDDARTNAFVAGYATTATSIGLAEYANRISYFTPRVEGLQLAASFTPDADANHNPNLDAFRTHKGDYIKNEYSLAANFDRDFDGLGANASFGYTAGDAPSGGTAVRDSEAIHAGIQLSYAGFTLGGAWGQYEDPTVSAGDTEAYGAGIKYETGPWGFGASFLYKEASEDASAFASGTGSTATGAPYGLIKEATFYEVGATYALGSGVTAGAGVYYNDNEDYSASTAEPEDSIAGVLNLSVAF